MFSFCGRPLLFGSFIINILCTCQPCLSVSPNHPTWAVPLRYSFLILTSQVSLSSCNPLLAATLTLVSTHLHLVCTFVFTTVSCSFAHMYSVLLQLTFIPLLSRGYLHLSRLSSICCECSSTPQSPPSTFLTHTFLSFYLNHANLLLILSSSIPLSNQSMQNLLSPSLRHKSNFNKVNSACSAFTLRIFYDSYHHHHHHHL